MPTAENRMKTVIPSTIAALHGTLPCADLQQSAMGWGQWMVPELTAETEFRLKAHEMEIREAMDARPKAVADLTVALAWQTAAQESIIRKATHRIAELEAREAVGQRSKAKDADYLRMARELRPMPWWVSVLWLLSGVVRRRPRP